MNAVTSRALASDHDGMLGHRPVHGRRRRRPRRRWRWRETRAPGRPAASRAPVRRIRRRRCAAPHRRSARRSSSVMLCCSGWSTSRYVRSCAQPLSTQVANMPLCLPLQFICSGVRPPPWRSTTCAECSSSGQVGRVAERLLVQARRRPGCARAAARCAGGAVVAGAHQGQQLGGRGPARRAPSPRPASACSTSAGRSPRRGRRPRRRSTRRASSATTAPKCTDSSNPLRSVIATGTYASGRLTRDLLGVAAA